MSTTIFSLARGNDSKKNATTAVFEEDESKLYFPQVQIIITPEVYAGGPRQPPSKKLTHLGALNRAKYALQEVRTSAYGIGIESGLIEDDQSGSGYINKTICLIVERDPEHRDPSPNVYYGHSSGFEVQKEIVDLILNHGLTLNQAYTRFLDSVDPTTTLGQRIQIHAIPQKQSGERERYVQEAVRAALQDLGYAKIGRARSPKK